MKKETKDPKGLRKLSLSRETLRNLEEEQLQVALGAATLQLSCDTISWRGCTGTRGC